MKKYTTFYFCLSILSIFSQIKEEKEINKQLGVFYQIYRNESREYGESIFMSGSDHNYFKYSNGYSVGIIYTYHNRNKSNRFKKFRFETGLLFSKLDDISETEYYSSYYTLSKISESSFMTSTDRTLTELIEIPLKINLIAANKKRFNFYFTTGLNTGYRTAIISKAYEKSKYERSGFFNYTFGLGFEFKFGKRISLNVEPNLRYLDNFNTVEDNFNTGVNGSLRYNF